MVDTYTNTQFICCVLYVYAVLCVCGGTRGDSIIYIVEPIVCYVIDVLCLIDKWRLVAIEL